MADALELKKRLDEIENDVAKAKKEILSLNIADKKKSEAAWNDLLSASDEISKQWKGSSAVEEIRSQREK